MNTGLQRITMRKEDMDMKKPFEPAKIEIILLEMEDVITKSGDLGDTAGYPLLIDENS